MGDSVIRYAPICFVMKCLSRRQRIACDESKSLAAQLGRSSIRVRAWRKRSGSSGK
jgi:hypothetical protein